MVSSVTHPKDEEDLLSSLLLVTGSLLVPALSRENFPDRRNWCHKPDFISLSLLSPCMAEQGM